LFESLINQFVGGSLRLITKLYLGLALVCGSV
jgi:hypothetical protein